ncbi:MAG TPA: hypothetical protein VF582_07615 [Allosphingosinicella sp.]
MASRVSGGMSQSHSGGRPPKKVKVKFTIEAVDRRTGEVTSYRSKQDGGEPCDDGKGNLDFMDKSKWDAPVEIDIKIDNQSDCTMALAQEPLWVVAGSCPNSPGSEPDFEVLSSNGALDLTLLDRNSKQGTYGYALRFQSSESQTGFFLLDPVIINGGGGFLQSVDS